MANPDDELQPLKLSGPERAALVVVADYGLAAIEEYGLVKFTGTTERAIDKLRSGKAALTRTEALALQNAIGKGFGAARRFGLPVEIEFAQRAEAKLAAIM